MTKRAILLQAIESTPADVARLVRSVDQDTAAKQPEPGSWSVLDVLSHLIAVDRAYHTRINRILTEDKPDIEPILPDTTKHDHDVSPNTMSERFGGVRAETVAILRGLSPGQWQRAGIHPEKGRITLRFLIQELVEHDIEHTNQLVEIVQAWRALKKRTAANQE